MPDVGPVVAEHLLAFFGSDANQQVLEQLLGAGVVWPVIATTEDVSGPLEGQTWVVSGKLESQSREEAEETLRSLGARTAKSVSAKTSVLLAGPGAGSKLTKAQSLGIETIDEQDFLARVAEASG